MSRTTFVFLSVMVGLVCVLQWTGYPGQDWVPFQAAGRLWVHGGPIYTYSQEFDQISRSDYGIPQNLLVPFVSPPLALPIAALQLPLLVVRLLGVTCFAYAVHRLKLGWETAFMCLPALQTVMVGQNAPLLVAAVVAPQGWAGFLLALCVAFKATPVVLILPLLLHARRRDLLAFGVTVLLLQTLVWLRAAPYSSWNDWYQHVMMATAIVDGLHSNLAAPLWIRILTVPLLLGVLYRLRKDFAAAWRVTWSAWPLLLPLTWGYYLWVTTAAVAGSRVPRWLMVLVVISFGAYGLPFMAPVREYQWIWVGLGFVITASAALREKRQELATSPVPASQ